MTTHADLILVNGDIRTQNPKRPRAASLAVRQGRIMALSDSGDFLELAGPDTKIVPLEGRLVLPGFMDCHVHFRHWSQNLDALPLAELTSFEGLIACLAESAEMKQPGEWISGSGWNEGEWSEPRMPTAADLDKAAPDNPVILWRCDMHMAVANSAALKIAGIDASTPDPPRGVIGRGPSGLPDGRLREAAMDIVVNCMPAVSDEKMAETFLAGQKRFHQLGLTGLRDLPGMNDMTGAAQSLRVWQKLRTAGEVKLRVWSAPAGESLDTALMYGVVSGLGDEILQIGHFKFFADGGMGARTAWMLEPYLDGGTGMPLMEMDDLEDAVFRADRAGLAVAVHSLGDKANRKVIGIFERLNKARTWREPALMHSIEHLQMISPEDLPRLRDLNIAIAVQPSNMIIDSNMADQAVGPKAGQVYAFRDIMDASRTVCFSSDAPVADPNPIFGIHCAVTRTRADGSPEGGWHSEQIVTVDEAVKAFTATPAAVHGAGNRLGTLEQGKHADIVVLDRNIYEIAPADIAGANVDLTIFNGAVVYSR